MSFTNLPISTKILAALGLLAALTIGVAVLSVNALATLNGQTNKLATDDSQTLYMAVSANEKMTRIQELVFEHILGSEAAELARLEGGIDRERRELQQLLAALKPFMDGETERRLFTATESDIETYLGAVAAVLDLSRKGEDSEAVRTMKERCLSVYNEVDELLAKIAEGQSGDLKESAEVANAIYASVRLTLLVVVGIGFVIAFSLSMLLVRGQITGPLNRMTEAMRRLADGDLSVEVTVGGRSDEIGQMAGAVLVFKENALSVRRLEAEQAEDKRRAEDERRGAMQALADAFEGRVKGVVEAVAGSAASMQDTARRLNEAAEQTNREVEAAGAASTQASANVQTVAVATEQLGGSIGEISQRTGQSREMAVEAGTQAGRGKDLVESLDLASRRIGEVVTLINSIAGQTNLLALNATIEAARAGEHGKGFAVVASEVKALATQTARATDEIIAQVSAVQQVATQTAQAITQISGTVGRIEEIATGIAGAVEEQSAATQGIGQSANEAARGTEALTRSIRTIADAAGSTTQGAAVVLQSAGDLANEAQVLRNEVASLMAEIRAA
ncbi:MCP four helix bundle domain-containing protein [Azospirillum sp. YIM B02556]|uniref:MCP four helix bundle domain-containing protein n=1 Tax=Azospirillum endophyticum TaxID=2800326 RepID=A0ABS1EYV6_9PROT|nr:methyl-accepting chemotaxis protein [Azospirillum endophyticum]MBK1836343.1 MCP four helix bundle domain-containing protein [Azospirillum endophyticum]